MKIGAKLTRLLKNRKIITVVIILVVGISFTVFFITYQPVKEELGVKDMESYQPRKTPEIQDEYIEKRKSMVENQLKARDINDPRVLAAMGKVKRHELVPTQHKDLAYEDYPLPIGYGQTISQPYIVALMTQSLDVKSSDKVLEIGTGSGYQAAVLAELAEQVYTIEIIRQLADSAVGKLHSLGYENVVVKNADGYFGWSEHAPFDKIIVTAAANHIPPPLLEQLRDGGKLIIPLGSTLRFQTLTLIIKRGNETEVGYITGVRFVPMTGEAQKQD